jgi:hypothetical protein
MYAFIFAALYACRLAAVIVLVTPRTALLVVALPTTIVARNCCTELESRPAAVRAEGIFAIIVVGSRFEKIIV